MYQHRYLAVGRRIIYVTSLAHSQQPCCRRYIELAVTCKLTQTSKLVFDIEMWKWRSTQASRVVLDCES